jgi:hypothetical protein
MDPVLSLLGVISVAARLVARASRGRRDGRWNYSTRTLRLWTDAGDFLVTEKMTARGGIVSNANAECLGAAWPAVLISISIGLLAPATRESFFLGDNMKCSIAPGAP